MKWCQKCGQLLAEEVTSCPSCGNEVVEGRRHIDEYRILEFLHEGYSSILCRAVKDGEVSPVMIRIFTPQSGVDQEIADRLKRELEELKSLPEDYFVRHLEIKRSSDGHWYRVSEWIEAESWSDMITSGALRDYLGAFRLFARIASILEGLHRIGHFMPHLILHDIIPFRGGDGTLQVKIDYKVSRFLDPSIRRPGPMLKKLISVHPDIVHQRPLDFKSDIWSLGKIFVELLSADIEIDDFDQEIESLHLPPAAEALFKTMLSDDPDLRPPSMARVAETLLKIDAADIEAAKQRHLAELSSPVHQLRGLKHGLRMLILLAIVVPVTAGLSWWFFLRAPSDPETTLVNYANRYAGSVAFVMVEYRLLGGETLYYTGRTEGTAFLVDKAGYLLTNRHVACPWLEDGKLYAIVRRLRELQRPARLEIDAHLWFEGERAFKRLPELSESNELEDRYSLETSFSLNGTRRLTVSGVAKVPEKTWQQIRSPLRDDFAVLQVQPVPANILPLPLDEKTSPLDMPKLLPVIALGFPLGSSTQETSINVSVTTGHVRRAFETFLQVDTSLYRGNSGGPVIDVNGNVIGIASSVAVDWASAPLPVATPLSDLGMVLPIAPAAKFLRQIRAGAIKWNGMLDLSVAEKIRRILGAADDRNWSYARDLAEMELEKSRHPELVMTAAMMQFCAGDYAKSTERFQQSLSLDNEQYSAAFMLYLIDWLQGRSNVNNQRERLLSLDWRSPQEYFGVLVRLLENREEEAGLLQSEDDRNQSSWFHFAAGLKKEKEAKLSAAEARHQKALLLAEPDHWVRYLSRVRLESLKKQRLAAMESAQARNAFLARIEAFESDLQKITATRRQHREKRLALKSKASQKDLSIAERRSAIEELLRIEPSDPETLQELVYIDTIAGEWERALKSARKFLTPAGREDRKRLRIGLLEAQLLKMDGAKEAAVEVLQEYRKRITDEWYRKVAGALLSEGRVQELLGRSATHPEYILTARLSLGLWAEGDGNDQKAVSHYREALLSYLDDTPEYELAAARIRALREKKGKGS